MRYRDEEEILIERAQLLARDCQREKVKKNQVHQILAHLQSKRDVAATTRLLEGLTRSCFAKRSNFTSKQYRGLEKHIGSALRGQRDWRQMARLLGWVCRFMEARRVR